jgi:hypothetical protein
VEMPVVWTGDGDFGKCAGIHMRSESSRGRKRRYFTVFLISFGLLS